MKPVEKGIECDGGKVLSSLDSSARMAVSLIATSFALIIEATVGGPQHASLEISSAMALRIARMLP